MLVSYSSEYLAVYLNRSVSVYNIANTLSVNYTFKEDISALSLYISRDTLPQIACVSDSCVYILRITHTLTLATQLSLSERVISISTTSQGYTVLLATGTISLINANTFELVPTQYHFEKPQKLVSCADSCLLVTTGHHMHTMLTSNQRFRLDRELLTFASLSDGNFFLITEIGIAIFANNTLSHIRDFEQVAEAAFIYKVDKGNSMLERVHSIIVFPRVVAVLRRHETVWMFAREPGMSKFLFVNNTGYLVRVFEDGTFKKDPLDLAWRQSVGSFPGNGDRDLGRLQRVARDLGLLGQQVTSSAAPKVAMMDTSERDIEKFRIPSGRVAYLTAYILSVGEKELGDTVYEMFDQCVDELTPN
jgi:hypothetical protein